MSTAMSSLARARAEIERKSTTAERVADAIRDEVVEGRLRCGERLPEKELCDALGVSRNTLREAFTQLVAERVLVREHNRGMFVAEPGRETVRDVYRARRLLEPAVLEHGEAFSTDGVAAMRAAVEEGRAAAAERRWDDVGSANQHFHRAVVDMSGSERMRQQMNLLLAEMRLVFHRMPDVGDFHEPYVEHNAAIVELLEAGDRAGAATRMAEYLAIAEEHLIQAF